MHIFSNNRVLACVVLLLVSSACTSGETDESALPSVNPEASTSSMESPQTDAVSAKPVLSAQELPAQQLTFTELISLPLDIRAEFPVDVLAEPITRFAILGDTSVAFFHNDSLNVLDIPAFRLQRFELPCKIRAGFLSSLGRDSIIVCYGSSILGLTRDGKVFYQDCDQDRRFIDLAANSEGLVVVQASHYAGTGARHQNTSYAYGLLDFARSSSPEMSFIELEIDGISVNSTFGVDAQSIYQMYADEIYWTGTNGQGTQRLSPPMASDTTMIPIRVLGADADELFLHYYDLQAEANKVVACNLTTMDFRVHSLNFQLKEARNTEIPSFTFMEEWPNALVLQFDAPGRCLYALLYTRSGQTVFAIAPLPRF